MSKWEPTCSIPRRGRNKGACGNVARQSWEGEPVCTRHIRELHRATPLEAWMLTQGIRCPDHPARKLERKGDRMVCRTRTAGGGINPNVRTCGFSARIPAEAARGGTAEG